MNKKNNRKGFTIVELVIVIAVIAILATVLVPTFSNVIKDANDTALLQEVKNEYTNYTVNYAASEGFTENLFILLDGKYYEIENGAVKVSGKAPMTGTPGTDAVIFDAATDFVVHAFKDELPASAVDSKCDICGNATGGTCHSS